MALVRLRNVSNYYSNGAGVNYGTGDFFALGATKAQLDSGDFYF